MFSNPNKMNYYARWALVGLMALAVVASILLGATAQGRTAVRTALFLPQILPAAPVKPLDLFTREPARLPITYPLSEGEGSADLYVPAFGERHSAILLFLGVNPAGRDDPRVVGLADALARTGVVVMIPWSENMTRNKVTVSEVDDLVRAFQFLRSHESVNPEMVGMSGFCVGASLTLVAAQDPRIKESVRFVNFFGGYFNAEDLVKSVVTRSRYYGDTIEPWEPASLSIQVVRTHLIQGITDPEDRQLLEAHFLAGGTPVAAAESLVSSEARTVYKLLSDPTPTEADALIESLSASIRGSLMGISPSTAIDQLEARVLIMHDREDRLVPSEESARLFEALGEDSSVYYTEFAFFQHLDPTRPVSPPIYVREGIKLFLHMYNVMRAIS
ncbi:MAG: dienelactone hydrolase family protein [Chloroflexi bacterium]|nr:dienelactone hydrolase family protein [Chloroflexota bacterium]